MHNKLIAFVTDRGYLVPSLVAAKQLVAQGVHEVADIVIYTIGVDEGLLERIQASVAGIALVPMASRTFERAAVGYFHQNHVPVAAMARLSLGEVMPRRYEHVVYMDGDVQVTGDILPLLAYTVPEGHIAAGVGSAWIDPAMTPDGYLEALGGVDPRAYFNSGVLAFRRSTWDAMAPRALEFFLANAEACVRHDQSALNAVFRDRVVAFAPRYNFHHVYAQMGVQDAYRPSIVHFTGPDKPWAHAGPPWYGRFAAFYSAALAEHPELGGAFRVTVRQAPRRKEAAGRLRSRMKRLRRPDLRRARFLDYVAKTEFPF